MGMYNYMRENAVEKIYKSTKCMYKLPAAERTGQI